MNCVGGRIAVAYYKTAVVIKVAPVGFVGGKAVNKKQSGCGVGVDVLGTLAVFALKICAQRGRAEKRAGEKGCPLFPIFR